MADEIQSYSDAPEAFEVPASEDRVQVVRKQPAPKASRKKRPVRFHYRVTYCDKTITADGTRDLAKRMDVGWTTVKDWIRGDASGWEKHGIMRIEKGSDPRNMRVCPLKWPARLP